ncbi:hypothetical protein DIPPA_01413 [Diplonema papillatum]|nr:hypothetical protein DIPPA_01413 [Diplonema papillatum]
MPPKKKAAKRTSPPHSGSSDGTAAVPGVKDEDVVMRPSSEETLASKAKEETIAEKMMLNNKEEKLTDEKEKLNTDILILARCLREKKFHSADLGDALDHFSTCTPSAADVANVLEELKGSRRSVQGQLEKVQGRLEAVQKQLTFLSATAEAPPQAEEAELRQKGVFVKLEHVLPREQNLDADALSNRAMDEVQRRATAGYRDSAAAKSYAMKSAMRRLAKIVQKPVHPALEMHVNVLTSLGGGNMAGLNKRPQMSNQQAFEDVMRAYEAAAREQTAKKAGDKCEMQRGGARVRKRQQQERQLTMFGTDRRALVSMLRGGPGQAADAVRTADPEVSSESLADDATLLAAAEAELQRAVDIVARFCALTGMRLYMSKALAMGIHAGSTQQRRRRPYASAVYVT